MANPMWRTSSTQVYILFSKSQRHGGASKNEPKVWHAISREHGKFIATVCHNRTADEGGD